MMITSPRCLLLALCISLVSCGRPASDASQESGEAQTPTVMLRRAAITDITDRGIIAQYIDFKDKTGNLITATTAWSQEASSVERREAARQAWREAMTSWQRAEVAQLGPAGIMGEVAGGEDLRNLLYSWPLTNPCRVDQELVKQEFNNAGYFDGQLVNVRGLDALEYAIFYEGASNSCAPNATLNSGTDWSSLTPDALNERRASFAAAAAKDLDAQAELLLSHWQERGENFRAQLVNAGTTSNTYGDTQEALNALSDAMFYIEKETKDMKLAIPAGISQCDTMTCPEALEHPYADFALEASLANHLAFQTLYLGNIPGEPEGRGFDDLLIDLGQEALDTQLQALMTDAIDAHRAIDMPLSRAIVEDLPAVIALHDASQALGLLIKTQFISVLDLELPQRAEGDND